MAGLTAAITLARAGEDVEVSEMKARVGSSAGPHTEGVRNYLGRDGLDDLHRFGVKVEAFSLARKVVRRSPHFVSTVTGPSYYLVARGGGEGTVERQLLRQALDAGATVRFRTRVRPEDVDILATGAPRDRVNIIAAGYRFTREGSNLPDDEIYALFDNAVAPRGYLCVLPGPVWHSVYSCAWGDIPYASLLALVDRALRFDWVQPLLGSARRVGRIFGKGYFHPNPLEDLGRGRPLVAGESGGIQDGVGGYGIRYAISSGHLAARALLGDVDYRAALEEEYRDEFEAARRGRAWLDAASNDDYDRMLEKLGAEVSLGTYAGWRGVRFL